MWQPHLDTAQGLEAEENVALLVLTRHHRAGAPVTCKPAEAAASCHRTAQAQSRRLSGPGPETDPGPPSLTA